MTANCELNEMDTTQASSIDNPSPSNNQGTNIEPQTRRETSRDWVDNVKSAYSGIDVF